MLIRDVIKELLNSKYPVYCYELQDENLQPFYVGISSRISRFHEHLSFKDLNFLKQKKIKDTINLTGQMNVQIVAYFKDWDSACQFEMDRISHYGRIIDSTGVLSNMTLGGDGRLGTKNSQRQREAASISNKGKTLSEETKEKIRVSRQHIYVGENTSFFGKKHTEETKALISEKLCGDNNPSRKAKGENHFNRGRVHSEETKLKISKKKSGKCKDEAFKSKLKHYWENQPEIICPNCGKTSRFKAAMVRYHFENCKN